MSLSLTTKKSLDDCNTIFCSEKILALGHAGGPETTIFAGTWGKRARTCSATRRAGFSASRTPRIISNAG